MYKEGDEMALKGKKCCLRFMYQLLQIEMLSDGSLFTTIMNEFEMKVFAF